MSHETATRQRLIEAGLRVFGRRGYEGATTRQLAREAGVNCAAIPYHFKGKQGLYSAVIEFMAHRAEARLLPVLQQVTEQLDDGQIARTELPSLVGRLLSAVVTMALSPDGQLWRPMIMREQLDPTPDFEVLYCRVMGRVHSLCSQIVGQYVGAPSDSEEVIIRAHTLLGQAIGFMTAQAVILRRLGVTALEEHHLERVASILGEMAESSLRGLNVVDR